MELKTILITGSNGLLGQTLVRKLNKRSGIKLIATSRGKNRINQKDGYIYENVDVTDEAAVKKVIDRHQPEALIHTAAMTNVDQCESNRAACRELNVSAVEHLLNACLPHQTHFIHLSTDFIFDGEASPYRETDSPAPLSYYGETKLEAEEIIKHSALPWAIARTILVYGVVGDMSRSNIVLWAKAALEKKQELSIVNDQFRTPTYVDDLADGCIAIAEKKATGIFHLSGKDFMSIVELVKRVASYYHLDDSFIREVSSETLNQTAGRPPKTGFILDKAKAILNYNPHSFEEGISLMEKKINHKMD